MEFCGFYFLMLLKIRLIVNFYCSKLLIVNTLTKTIMNLTNWEILGYAALLLLFTVLISKVIILLVTYYRNKKRNNL